MFRYCVLCTEIFMLEFERTDHFRSIILGCLCSGNRRRIGNRRSSGNRRRTGFLLAGCRVCTW